MVDTADGSGPGPVPIGTPAELADPLTARYFEKVRSFQIAAAAGGDRSAIAALATSAGAAGKDDGTALAYWAALLELSRSQDTAGVSAYAGVVGRLGRLLTDEQRSTALAEGHRYAQAAQAACAECLPATPAADVFLSPVGAASLNAAAAISRAGGSDNLKPWSPNDVVTFCDPSGCQQVRYSAAGVWLKVANEPGS